MYTNLFVFCRRPYLCSNRSTRRRPHWMELCNWPSESSTKLWTAPNSVQRKVSIIRVGGSMIASSHTHTADRAADSSAIVVVAT